MNGITLKYNGMQFNKNVPDETGKSSINTDNAHSITNTNSPHTAHFKEIFSEVGALVMRYNLGLRQRSALLQQTTMRAEDYDSDPVQNVAKGGDEQGLFSVASNSKTYTDSMQLCLIAHSTLGKSKVVNDRLQPSAEVNRKDLTGEQRLWDIVHSAVWQAGISLPYALDDQGFHYIACPENCSPDDYEKISQAMQSGEFKVSENHVEVMGENLEKCLFKHLEINANPDSKHPTSLSVNHKNKQEHPAGFIIGKNGQALPDEHSDGLLKVIKVAKGGTLLMSDDEQRILLTGGFLSSNTEKGKALFTQNITFNAMVPIFAKMEAATGFSLAKAMQKNAYLASKRLQDEIRKNPKSADDFLAGALLTEMVQPLKTTAANGGRAELPLRFNNSHLATLNNTKAMARAFSLTDGEGSPLLKTEENQLSQNSNLIDVQVNGQLVSPKLVYPQHLAAIVATGILTAEQLILETLIKDAINVKGESVFVLKDILGSDEAETALVLAHGIPFSRVGRQYAESDELVSFVRDVLNTKKLIELANNMMSQNKIVPDEETYTAFKRLEKIGDTLQKYMMTSGQAQHSRGIAAGLALVEEKLPKPIKSNFSLQSIYKKLRMA